MPIDTNHVRRPSSGKALAILAPLLILFASIVVGQFVRCADLRSLVVHAAAGSGDARGATRAMNAARLGILGGLLIIGGSAASLVYRPGRKSRPWTIAVSLLSLAVAICVYLAILGSFQLSLNPARGDFAGLANLAMLIVHVSLPTAATLLASIVIGLLCLIRRSSSERGHQD